MIIYSAPDAIGSNTGETWWDAYTNYEYAEKAASHGDIVLCKQSPITTGIYDGVIWVNVINRAHINKKPSKFGTNDVFIRVNYASLTPHNKPFGSTGGLIFIQCNLLNCNLPVDAQKISCLHCHKSFCANLHPSFNLPAEDINCEHVVDSDTVTVDGKLVITNYKYEDQVVS